MPPKESDSEISGKKPVLKVTPAASIREYQASSVALKRIHFEGIDRTKHKGLVAETAELFKSTDFNELVRKCFLAKNHMEDVGLCARVEVVIDVDRGTDPDPDGYEVLFFAKEPDRLKGNLFAGLAQDGETECTVSAEFPSLTGRAETLFTTGTLGHRHTSAFDLGLRVPFLGWQRFTGVNISAGTLSKDLPWNKAHLRETGPLAELYHRLYKNVDLRLKGAASWRFLEANREDTAFAILEHCGHSFKTSLNPIVTFSTLDSEVVPTRGLLARLSLESAGWFGDIRFNRVDLEFKSSAKVIAGFILSANLLLSHVQPKSGPTLHMVDRVFLGGPTSVRGFARNRIGPSDNQCSVGGASSWELGIHLLRPLFPLHFLYGHLFCTAGNIHRVHQGVPIGDIVRELSRDPRLSIGAGIAINVFGRARVEVNYAWPIRFRPSDRIEPGLQFGAGFSFL